MSVAIPVELNDEVSIYEQSSPESLRARALSPPPPHVKDHQPSTSEEQLLNTSFEDDFSHHKLKQYSSNRSSISSLPASVIHNTLFSEYEDVDRRTPSRLLERSGTPESRLNIPGYMYGFRNPSSVRALQLGESEYTDTDAQSMARGYRQRKVPKVSYFSPRSPGSTQSSPTKRSSRPNTPQHQRNSSKLKKEFPLVLLHCTILPPAVATRLSQVPDDLYEAVLPEEYKKRWRTLQDKVAQNTEVRQRGILIPHPREDYDLLEERLLETLELQRPRIRQHHFLPPESVDGVDSGFESSSQTDEGSDPEPESQPKCPDCGKGVSSDVEQERKWQVKVYAANGLMKAGAWAAAWQEMEKVDIEVGVWMPEDVRTEVDERLTSLQALQEAEKPVAEPPPTSPQQRTHRHKSKSARAKLRHDERMKEIYGDPDGPTGRTEPDFDDLAHQSPADPVISTISEGTHSHESADRRPHVTFAPDPVRHSSQPQTDNTISIIRRRVNNIMQDQKSLAILLLSMLVLFFAIQNARTGPSSAATVLSPNEQQLQGTPSLEREAGVSYITTTVFAPIPATDSPDEPISAAVETSGAIEAAESYTNDEEESRFEKNDILQDLFSDSLPPDPIPFEDDTAKSSIVEVDGDEPSAITESNLESGISAEIPTQPVDDADVLGFMPTSMDELKDILIDDRGDV